MLYFIIAWAFLTVVCYVIGTNLLNSFKADCFEQRGDRFIIAVWLGVVVLCLSLLTTSLVLPLSSLVGLAIAGILVSLSLLSRQTRTEVFDLRSSLSPGLIGGFLALEVLVAALTTQQIVWFDTGLYHFGSIKWLSEYGAVPGVALMNPKFGFTSSWFAFAAPLTPKLFADRVGAITNGFVFLIAIVQFFITLVQTFKNKAQLSDWFLWIFSLIFLSTYTVTAFTGSPIVISFSPDVAITLLIGVTAWTILVISSNGRTNGLDAKISSLDAQTIPLILSAGAVSIKLSALPLLLVGFLFYSLATKFKIQRVIWGSAFLILLLSPVILFSITTSGCPLYPSTFMCLDLPWTVTAERVISEAKDIQFWDTLIEPESSSTPSWLSAAWNWLKGSKKSQLMTLLILLSTSFAVFFLVKLKQITKQGIIWLIGLGLLGITFIMLQSPLLRFGLGYFILIPCLFVAFFCQKKIQIINKKFAQLPLSTERNKIKIVFLIPLFLVGLVLVGLFQGEAQSRLLLPSKLPNANLVSDKVNDVEYTYPANWYLRCWAAKLPCSALPINKNIKLRDPSQGIGGGFVHAR